MRLGGRERAPYPKSVLRAVTPRSVTEVMKRQRKVFQVLLAILLYAACAGMAHAQGERDEEFGPVVRAYLGYLRNEQEVVDDRASRHEVSRAYYVRNSNRIRALRQTAIRIARETENDYLPELEAAARDELKNLFEEPPKLSALRVGEVINNTFRYLGTVRSGEIFYIFSRLDPYEQAELMEKQKQQTAVETNKPPAPVSAPVSAPAAETGAEGASRPRRASSSAP